MNCPRCSTVVSPDARFCSACGAPLAADAIAPPRRHRVVVTGLGAITSLGPTVEETWRGILAGETGIRRADNLDGGDHACRVRGDVDSATIPQRALTGKVARNASRFTHMAIEATADALLQAGLVDANLEPTADLSAGGAVIGTCVGGTHDDFLAAWDNYKTRGEGRIAPHLHVMFPHNLAAYNIQARWGMGGPSLTLATACATGAQAIGEAFREVREGHAPIMIAGAVESTQHPMFISGFAAMRALPTDSNDDPGAASRPFDASRAGFVLGEGAAALVLESLEHAEARGASILAEIVGFATSNDAYHPIAPIPEGTGSARAIRAALADAGLSPEAVDHINAHAASTPAGDLAEANAIRLVFGERAADIPVTSIKGAVGHCMGASGAIETVAAVMTIVAQTIPPTRNYRTPDPAIGLDIVHDAPRPAAVNVASKHSFGLGGQNACLILARFADA
ncbi:MAG: beta-ketoacyl-ACP synthase II [Thermomicrobiales bacterium]|nr:beta-ketoacyl-ACP synthase II [Thermomicrobiales bacterium]